MDEHIREQLLSPVRDFVRPVSTTLETQHTIAQALQLLRATNIPEAAVYFYITDEQDHLQGVVSTRSLLLAQPETRLESLMNPNVVRLPAEQTLEDALRVFAEHRYLALPVVEADGRLIGAIDVRLYANESAGVAASEHQVDLFQIIGLWVQDLDAASSLRAYVRRMPWLGANLLGGTICAAISTWFGVVVEAVLIVAVFIPMVLTLCEAMGIQSLTLAIQSLHQSKIHWPRLNRMAHKEWQTSLMMGLSCGLIVSAMALGWALLSGESKPPDPQAAASVSAWAIAGVIACSISVAMFLSAMVGFAVPLGLHLLRLDPKLAAGPMVLMLADSIALLIYLGLATWWLL